MKPLVYSLLLTLVTLPHISSSVSEDDCSSVAVELDFYSACSVTVNNLGGQGPNFDEPEQIRYSNVGTYDGETFDMIIEIRPESSYTPANYDNNGLNGKFGIVNILLGATVDFQVSFLHSTTDELITLPYLYFSFFDLDQGSNTQENLCMNNNQFYSLHIIDNNEEVTMSTSTSPCSEVDDDSTTGSTILSSNSESRGFGCDNPDDPNTLGVVTCEDCTESCEVDGKNAEYFPIDQRNRSVSFTFVDVNQFYFTFGVDDTTGNTNGRNLLFAGRSSLSPCNPSSQPTLAPVPSPTKEPTTSGTNGGGGGGRTCFSSDDKVTLESGKMIPFRSLQIGDSILSANRDGDISYSNVVFLPHGENDQRATFVEIKTKKMKKSLKMTRAHLIPLCSGSLSIAANLKVGSCIRTIDGDDEIMSTNSIKMNGVYTAVTENEFLVVNGIIASPFASSGALVHAFFNITDIEDWCASNDWLAFENAKHAHSTPSSSTTLKEPSIDCLTMLNKMFENYKDEPVGWGVDGFGYRRHWSNPASPNIHGDHQDVEKEQTVPLTLSGWNWDANKTIKNRV